jgi:predicted GNAT family N-acyltransferase
MKFQSAWGAVECAVGPWFFLRTQAEAIRLAVFVAEQGVPLELEWDEHDAPALHALAFLDKEPVGTARLLRNGKIGRMAVLAHARRKGVGRVLLQTMMQQARASGLAEVFLDAQLTARGFYEREGFIGQGETFLDAGIEHLLMRCSLEAIATPPQSVS